VIDSKKFVGDNTNKGYNMIDARILVGDNTNKGKKINWSCFNYNLK